MKKIKIVGNRELKGRIEVSGAKNSVVALIPAAIMTEEKVEIYNVPNISDTVNLNNIIELLGGKIEFGNGILKVDGKNVKSMPIPEELSVPLRASYYFMGALLARCKHVEIYSPGGCKIGSRPIDLHLKAFKKMGVSVIKEKNKFVFHADDLHGANIYLDIASVGATINILFAASMARGTTIIENAAMEPEIVNVVSLLNNMGARISGAGTSKITIVGVDRLHGANIETIPDRIEAGTFMMIGALIGNPLCIHNIIPEHVDTLIAKLRDMGAKYKIDGDSIIFEKVEKFLPVDIKTLVYPGFPTDLGQPMAVMLTQAAGISNFEETIYESRSGHFPELIKMGATIEFDKMYAKVSGPSNLKGTEVTATDLRAGASLIIAGLIAEGTTKISNIEYILRGYEDIVEKLKAVGADIEIIDE